MDIKILLDNAQVIIRNARPYKKTRKMQVGNQIYFPAGKTEQDGILYRLERRIIL